MTAAGRRCTPGARATECRYNKTHPWFFFFCRKQFPVSAPLRPAATLPDLDAFRRAYASDGVVLTAGAAAPPEAADFCTPVDECAAKWTTNQLGQKQAAFLALWRALAVEGPWRARSRNGQGVNAAADAARRRPRDSPLAAPAVLLSKCSPTPFVHRVLLRISWSLRGVDCEGFRAITIHPFLFLPF
jgi:hypothetical protein